MDRFNELYESIIEEKTQYIYLSPVTAKGRSSHKDEYKKVGVFKGNKGLSKYLLDLAKEYGVEVDDFEIYNKEQL